MLQKAPIIASTLLGFAASVSAVAEWGQCGGMNYSGSTVCDSPWVCVYSNPYYSQCLPGSSTTTTTTTTTTKSTTTTKGAVTTTSSSTTKGATTTSSPATTTTSSKTSTTSTAVTTGACGTFGNPYTGYTAFISPYYVAEVNAAIAGQTDATLKTKSAAVAKVPNFTWFDTASKVPTLSTYLASAQAMSSTMVVQIVIYDLPNRDCHAKASNGEYTIANNGVANYKAYIDAIGAAVSAYPGVRVVAVVEPDSLANLVTNLSDPNCQAAQSAYMTCTTYVLQKLTQCNIWLYLDAGHAGWLGWTSNLQPAATLFAQVYNSAKPNRVRGLATDVANYNALSAATPDPITSGDPNYDEIHYINALAPLLSSAGFPASFIVDQGRSGVQNIRVQWGDWCNINHAGFGMRPTTSTGSSLIDAIVWVKPGGECDGTSNSSAPRYDSTCSLSDALQPAPQAGTWFEAYFEMLTLNAVPAF
jgi:cellulose 1,4-beta-cellobiosidase